MAAAALALGVGITLTAALPASAHVTLADNAAEAGSYTLLEFKVPNESTTESTTKIVLTLPADTPFLSVRYVPVPGWTTELVKTTLPESVVVGDLDVTEAVTSVVWTAAGDGIPDGALEVFPLSLGPVPDVESVVLAVDQTYSSGREVSWSDPAPDADHPAPVLQVTAAADTTHAGHESHAEDAAAATPDAAASDSDGLARVLAGAGLALGVVAILIALLTRRRRG
jgi:uncharacterized protein YcnI